jgi:hypothetical protein
MSFDVLVPSLLGLHPSTLVLKSFSHVLALIVFSFFFEYVFPPLYLWSLPLATMISICLQCHGCRVKSFSSLPIHQVEQICRESWRLRIPFILIIESDVKPKSVTCQKRKKKKKTVANCEGWRQPASLFSGWGLVQKSSSLCLIHTGLLVLNEAMADWSSVLHPWVTGLIVMWPVSFGLFRLILQPFPLHAVWPFIPSSQENTAWNQKTISQERGSLSFY